MSRRSEQRAKRAEKQWAEDLKWLLAAPQGRRIVANIISLAGLAASAFTGNSMTFYNQGRQDFVRTLIDNMRRADLAGFRRVEDEIIAAEQEASRERPSPDDDPDET